MTQTVHWDNKDIPVEEFKKLLGLTKEESEESDSSKQTYDRKIKTKVYYVGRK